jgi:catalase
LIASTLPEPGEKKLPASNNIVGSLKDAPKRIQELHVQHFYKADSNYGMAVAKALGLDVATVFGTAGRVEEKLVPAD